MHVVIVVNPPHGEAVGRSVFHQVGVTVLIQVGKFRLRTRLGLNEPVTVEQDFCTPGVRWFTVLGSAYLEQAEAYKEK